MKKILAILMVLCMFACSAALAEPVELNWEDVEPALSAGGVQGDFVTFDEIAVKIWLPSDLKPTELSDEDREAGYIGYFQTDAQDAIVAVMYVDVDGTSLEDYAAQLPDLGATEIEMVTLNGLSGVSYKLEENDTVSIAFTTEAGYILEVTMWPASEEGADLVWGCVGASIQAE